MRRLYFLIAIIGVSSVGCHSKDFEWETRDARSAQPNGSIGKIEAMTFNGDISFVSDPAQAVDTEVTKRCKGKDPATDQLAATDTVLDNLPIIDGKLDIKAAEVRCDHGADFDIVSSSTVQLELVNTNGNVSVAGQTGGAKLGTINGHIKAANLAGGIDGQVTNGNIDCDVAELNKREKAVLSTTNGDIILSLPHDISAVFDASSINGTVTINGFPSVRFTADTTDHKTGRLGSGEAVVSVHSTNGNITINARKTR